MANLPSRVVFEVEDAQIKADMARLQAVLPGVNQRISDKVGQFARGILIGDFEESWENLDYEAFAPEFRDALIKNLLKLPIRVTPFGGTAGEVDFALESLGNEEDLRKAFHRHAVLKEHRRIQPMEPYVNQSLAIEDADVRHEYFEAMIRGEPFQGRDGRIIETTGEWDRTKKEYLALWGDKSPQWLYLEHGQQRFEPKIPAFHIVQNLQDDIASVVSIVFKEEIDAAIQVFEKATTFTTVQGGTGYRSPKGGITIRGKFYPGGEFVGPKANY